MRYSIVKYDYSTGEVTSLLPGQDFPKTTALRKCKAEAKKLEAKKQKSYPVSNGYLVGMKDRDQIYGIHICEVL